MVDRSEHVTQAEELLYSSDADEFGALTRPHALAEAQVRASLAIAEALDSLTETVGYELHYLGEVFAGPWPKAIGQAISVVINQEG